MTDLKTLLKENEDYIGYVTIKEAADVLESAGYRIINDQEMERTNNQSLSHHIYRIARTLTSEEYNVLTKDMEEFNNSIIVKKQKENMDRDKESLISRINSLQHIYKTDKKLWDHINTPNGLSITSFKASKISNIDLYKEYCNITTTNAQSRKFLLNRYIGEINFFFYTKIGLITTNEPSKIKSYRRYVLAPEGDPLSYKFKTIRSLVNFLQTATEKDIVDISEKIILNEYKES